MKLRVGLSTMLVLLLAAGAAASAQKRISSTGTNYGSGAMKVSSVDRDIWVSMLDQLGIRVEDSGEGPFHQVSTDLEMVMYQDRDGLHYHGYETWVDRDGDKVLWEIWDSGGKGLGRVITGTGKFAGIEGTMTFVLKDPPKPFPEGTIRTVCRETIKVTLKNLR